MHAADLARPGPARRLSSPSKHARPLRKEPARLDLSRLVSAACYAACARRDRAAHTRLSLFFALQSLSLSLSLSLSKLAAESKLESRREEKRACLSDEGGTDVGKEEGRKKETSEERVKEKETERKTQR